MIEQEQTVPTTSLPYATDTQNDLSCVYSELAGKGEGKAFKGEVYSQQALPTWGGAQSVPEQQQQITELAHQ